MASTHATALCRVATEGTTLVGKSYIPGYRYVSAESGRAVQLGSSGALPLPPRNRPGHRRPAAPKRRFSLPWTIIRPSSGAIARSVSDSSATASPAATWPPSEVSAESTNDDWDAAVNESQPGVGDSPTSSAGGWGRTWRDEEDGGGDGDAEGAVRRPRGGSPLPLLALGGAVVLEFLITGSLLLTPLAAGALALLALPAASALSAAQAAAREAEAVRRAEARVRAEMLAHVPVTPPESAAWVNRLMAELWEPFVQPLVLLDSLSNWAEKVRRAAPAGAGLELELQDISMGREAPQLRNMQVHANPATGRVTSIDCDMLLESSSLRAVVTGTGPVGRFTATVTGVTVRGRMRLLPIPSQRLILFSFKETPQIDPKLTVQGPLLGERDISPTPTSLLRPQLAAALQDCLVEPRRGAISLDPQPLVGQPIDAVVNIYIESIHGLSADTVTAPTAPPTPPPTPTPAPPRPPESGPDTARQRQPPPSPSGGARTAPGAAAGAAEGAAASPRPLSPPPSEAEKAPAASGGLGRSVVAAASSAAVEAVAEGAGAIASLVPGLGGAAGAAEAGRRRKQRRKLQVVAVNTDTKLQRATSLVPYTPLAAAPLSPEPPSPSSSFTGAAASAAASAVSSSASGPSPSASPSIIPVNQMLRLNVGHKDGIFKLMVRDVGRGASPGPTPAGASAAAAGTSSVAAAVSGAAASLTQPVSGGGSLVGSVVLHVAAARDGSTLFWAAKEGGEPVAVRWRPSDGPWRVTLPLECPTFGLPPPPVVGDTAAAAAPSAGNRTSNSAPSSAAGGGGSNSSGGGGDRTAPASATQPSSAAAAGGQSPPLRTAAGANGISAASDAAGGATPATTGSSSSAASGGSEAPRGSGGRVTPAAAASVVTARRQGEGPPPSITLLLSADPWVYKTAPPPDSNLYDSPRPRSLVLQVVEARDLASTDWAGTCDPYVRIKYEGRTYRTRTLYNTYTPVWHQTFILPDNRTPPRPTAPPRNRLSLLVYDSGVSRDERLGAATLNLDMASDHEVQDRWIPLEGVESGWLRVRLAAVPDTPDSAAVRRAVEALQTVTRGSGPLLQVVVLGARALQPRPVGQLLGMRDSYCSISYGGARHVTPVVKQSQNPRWDYCALFTMPPLDPDAAAAAGDSGGGQQRPGPGQGRDGAVAAATGAGGGASEAESGGNVSESEGGKAGRRGEAAAADPRVASGRNGQAAWDDATSPRTPPAQRQAAASGGGGGAAAATAAMRTAGSSGSGFASGTGGSGLSAPDSTTGASGRSDDGDGGSGSLGGLGAGLMGRRRRRHPKQDFLRLEVRDVDPVPPDDELGVVEVAVRALLPRPGDSWQGWLPLRRGGGGEVLVRIARVEPLPLSQGALRLERLEDDWRRLEAQLTEPGVQQQGQQHGQGGQQQGGAAAAGDGAGGGALAPLGPASSAVQRVMLDSFTSQVSAANRGAGQLGNDLRVRLGQDFIPKVQDWWEGTMQRTVTSLEPSGDQINSWLRGSGLSSWVAGLNAMAGRPPPPGSPKPPALLADRAQSAQPQQQQLPQQQSTKQQQQQGTSQGRQDRGTEVGGGAPSVAAAAASDRPSEEVADGGGGDRTTLGRSSSVGGTAARSRRGAPGEAGVGPGGIRGLGELVSRAWEQLAGPPAYQRPQQPQQPQQQLQSPPPDQPQQQQQDQQQQ